ncbi:MAG: ATP-binding protein [Candidatus Sumerlaeota bacterium]|nr:ATP-binding protein [Candidatus Sumerlaeota bacterium]
MRIRSFQLKIALVSVLLSGLSLCVFGALAWTLFYRMGLDRIDLEIKSWGQQQLTKFRLIREWERFEQDMIVVFGQNQHQDAVILLVRDPEGRIVYQSAKWPPGLDSGELPSPALMSVPPPVPPPARRPPPAPMEESNPPQPRDAARLTSPARFRTSVIGNQAWRVGVMANEHVTLAMGVSLEGFLAEMRQVRLAFLTALPATLLLIAAAGWLVSRRALQPVRRVTETARRITTAQGLSQRIPLKTEDYEFEELVTDLNKMLDRLQMSFQQAVRFSADAAHELKTPLTILQGELEQALREAPADSYPQRIFGDLMGEVLRLKAIVEKLLLLSKADAGQLRLHVESIDLVQLIEETIDDTAILAPHLTIDKDLIPEARVKADGDLLRQVLQNLASNAIKYNRADGTIVFSIRQSVAGVRFTIANTGEPIPLEERERIFDRFHRGDKSRGRRVDGVGLGLSLAREIVNAHQGKLILDDSVDGMTAFTMTLPAG